MQREMCEEKDERLSGALLEGKDERDPTRTLEGKDERDPTRTLDGDAIAGAGVARARWTLLRQVKTSSL